MNKTAEVLIEALPYIRHFYDRQIVIKYGGAAMDDRHTCSLGDAGHRADEICRHSTDHRSRRRPTDYHMDG